MHNIAKRIPAALLAAVVLVYCTLFVGLTAKAELFGALFDIEDVLTNDDETELNALLRDTAQEVGFCIGVIFTDNLRGQSAREYTEKFYDESFGSNSDGIMLMINGDFSSDCLDWVTGNGDHGAQLALQSQEILSAAYDGLNKNGFRGVVESFCAYLTGGAAAAEEVHKGYNAVLSDLDDVLTDSEELEALSVMQNTANAIECNVGVVITSDLGGKSDRAYADDFLDDCFTFGSSSIVLLYNNDRSNMNYVDWISTCGRGTDLYDARIDSIFDSVYDGLDPNDNYLRSIKYFCRYLENHTFDTSGNYVTYDSIDEEINLLDVVILMFFPCVFGLVFALVISFSVAGTYKRKKPISAAAYIENGRTRYTRKNDLFIREFTTHHTVSSSSSGGGHHSGGGGHHSSSHHSHGGGGGRRR